MRSKKFLDNICKEIYRQMYEEAEPPADFDELVNKGITKEPNWFMNYYLPIDRQEEIIREFIKKYKCSPYEERKIRETIYLGSAPNSNKPYEEY